MDITKTIEVINALMRTIGDVALSEAKTWLEVEENANQLLAEGHEGPPPAGDAN